MPIDEYFLRCLRRLIPHERASTFPRGRDATNPVMSPRLGQFQFGPLSVHTERRCFTQAPSVTPTYVLVQA
jgi:hypothetical protein